MEINVAINGPVLQHVDPILKETLKEMYTDAEDSRDRIGRFVNF